MVTKALLPPAVPSRGRARQRATAGVALAGWRLSGGRADRWREVPAAAAAHGRAAADSEAARTVLRRGGLARPGGDETPAGGGGAELSRPEAFGRGRYTRGPGPGTQPGPGMAAAGPPAGYRR
jgi:hypothetical protein